MAEVKAPTVEQVHSTTLVVLRSRHQHVEVHIGVICSCPTCEAKGEHVQIDATNSDEDNIQLAKAGAFKLLRADDIEVVGVMEGK